MGSRLGEWEVQGELGRGGQGVVLRARHAVHGTPAAIKLLLRREVKTVLRFRQEAAVLQRLNHPNLVRVLEVGEHEGAPFLAMELVVGQSLADLVREGGPPPFERAAKLLAAVARAVHHCHAQGVVHRDLKLENVIVERGTERAVLVDFGMVKRDRELFGALSIDELTRLSRTGELRGTPMYMAPEQVSSDGEVGPWTDVHALGAMLHVLLTGEPPYAADSLPGIVHAILAQPPADPRAANPAVPSALARLCLQARAKGRADRPRSAAAFAAALEASVGVGARRGPGLALFVAAGLVVVGGAAAGVVAALRQRAAGTPASTAPTTSATPTDPAPIASLTDQVEGDLASEGDLVERALAVLEAEPDLALALAEEALERDPGQLRARGARAAALLGLGRLRRPGGSEVPLEELVAVDPSLGWAVLPGGGPDPRLLDAWTVRAGRRFKDDDLAGAVEDVAQVLTLRPDDEWALGLRAQIALHRGDPAAALSDLERVLARPTTRPTPWRLKAEARLLLNDPRGALEDLAAARKLDPAGPDPLCTGARALAQLGDHEGAVAELGRLVGIGQGDDVDVRTYRASELVRLGRFQDALADLEVVLRLAPRNAQALSSRGALRWRAGERDLAAADFAEGDLAAAGLAPAARAQFYEDRARRRRAVGDGEGALADVDRALALAPTWARARAMRGTALYQLGRPKEALVAFEAAVAADPDAPDTYLERGQVREVLGDFAGAISDLDRALALGGVDEARTHLARSWNHLSLGHAAESRADAERCIALVPELWEGWIWRAKARKAQGELAGALEDLDEAVAKAPAGELRPLLDRIELRKALGDGPGAVADAAKVVELLPDDASGWHALGLAHRFARDDARAIAAFDRAIELFGEKAAATPSLQHRSICRRVARDFPGALADLEHALALRPDWWGIWHDLGVTRAQASDVKGALEAYGRAIERATGKDLVTPLLARANLLRTEKDLPGALADFDRAVEADPGRWESWNSRGWCRYQAKDHVRAVADFERAIALAPQQPLPWRNRSYSRRALKEWEAAEADLDRSLELDPKDGWSWASRGWLRHRRADPAGAITDFTRAIELGTEVGPNLRQRAVARRELGDVEGSLADVAAALEKDPRSIEAYVLRAYTRRDWLNDLDGALADDEAALAIDAASASARRGRALTRLLRGDAAGARADIDEAVRLAPDSVENLASRVRIRVETGQVALGLADAERAVALEPRSSTAQWVHGLALLAAGDAAGAVAACTSSVEAYARSPRALTTRAAALVALGRPTEALADLDRAVEVEPGRVDALLARAALREKTGDRPGAAADLREVLARLRPADPRRAATSAALARLEE